MTAETHISAAYRPRHRQILHSLLTVGSCVSPHPVPGSSSWPGSPRWRVRPRRSKKEAPIQAGLLIGQPSLMTTLITILDSWTTSSRSCAFSFCSACVSGFSISCRSAGRLALLSLLRAVGCACPIANGPPSSLPSAVPQMLSLPRQRLS